MWPLAIRLARALASALGISPLALALWAAATLAAMGGLGVVTWRVYAAGAASVQAKWDAAVEARRKAEEIANLDARQHQRDLARDQLAGEAETTKILEEITHAPAVADDPARPADRLSAGRVRALNRIR